MADFFEIKNGNVVPKEAIAAGHDADGNITSTQMTTDLEAALEAWAKTATATASADSNGDPELKFTDLPYGYYVMVTTHKDDVAKKALISVTSTKPTAEINDKNVNEPSADKKVKEQSYTIGQFVEYEADFDTTNYLKDDNGKDWQVIEYTISDTLPEFLDSSTVQVTKLTIDETDYKVDGAYPQFTDKKIVIPWATKNDDGEYVNDYANGVKIHVEYKAKLTSTVNVNAANTNTISIKPRVTDGTTEKPWDEDWHKDAVVTTYAAALKKTDGTKALAGAHFMVKGLTVEKTANGVYTVVSYDSTSTADGTDMEVDADGMLYIVGLKQGETLKIEETIAPDGFNKLSGTTNLTPQVLTKEVYKESGKRYYDAKGNLVKEESSATSNKTVEKNLNELDADAVEIVNKPGVELPGTGGIGTTIFYILGSLLVIGCGIVLISRKRMENNK